MKTLSTINKTQTTANDIQAAMGHTWHKGVSWGLKHVAEAAHQDMVRITGKIKELEARKADIKAQLDNIHKVAASAEEAGSVNAGLLQHKWEQMKIQDQILDAKTMALKWALDLPDEGSEKPIKI